MSNCFNKNCQLCKNLVFSDSITIQTIDGEDAVVIDIPAGVYSDCQRVCLVLTQTLPNAPINTPVVISIGGVTSTVYPIVRQDCSQATICAFRTRKKYPLKVSTSTASAVFKSLGKLACQPDNNLSTIGGTV